MQSMPLAARVATALVSYVTYIGDSILPLNLAVFFLYLKQLHLWHVASAGLILIAALKTSANLGYTDAQTPAAEGSHK